MEPVPSPAVRPGAGKTPGIACPRQPACPCCISEGSRRRASRLGGPTVDRERAYGALLAQHGYTALVPNSFLARGIRSESDTIRALYLTEAMMLADAFAALAYLARRPDVDPKRVFVVGFSYGGMIALLTAYQQLAELLLPGGPRFAGHVSYYGCSIPRLEDSRTTARPVLMLLAGSDRNVS
ncbi:MAG TPA: dienelactone hydrolase family protein, partial [Chloroflexota bacterium]|nr:dienelactone hydrolase family protein [Chloroflexota bacterium]